MIFVHSVRLSGDVTPQSARSMVTSSALSDVISEGVSESEAQKALTMKHFKSMNPPFSIPKPRYPPLLGFSPVVL